ncbi:MAG: ComEC/Rec2 family competence protein [Clostridia bacterium]|nr:ComEC/Rec2 family competence protein [Clostridia bacterium]
MKRPLFSAGVLAFAALLLCACLPYKIVFWLAVAIWISALLILVFAKDKPWHFSVVICLTICSLLVTGFYISTIRGPKTCEILIGKTATVTATVTTKPDFNGTYYVYSVTTDSVDYPNVSQNLNLELCVSKNCLEIGDNFKSTVKFYEIPQDYKTSLYGRSVYLRTYPKEIIKTGKTSNFLTFSGNLSYKVRKCILRNLPDEVSGILIGLITGGSHYLDDETHIAFKECGLSHIISVSGMHMALLASAVMTLLSLFGISRKIGFWVCVPLLLLYTAISGFSPAAIRSVVMISATFLGNVFYRRSDSLTNLGFTGIVMLLISPYLIYNISFLLSFTSMMGILFAAPFSMRLCNKIFIKGIFGDLARYITSMSLTTISANLATLPLVLLIWNGVSTVSVIANLFICFAVSVCLIFSLPLVTLILIFGENSLFRFMFKPIEYILWFVRYMAISISNIPFSYLRMSVSDLLFVCCIGCAVVALICYLKRLPKQRVWSAVNYSMVFMVASIITYKII